MQLRQVDPAQKARVGVSAETWMGQTIVSLGKRREARALCRRVGHTPPLRTDVSRLKEREVRPFWP